MRNDCRMANDAATMSSTNPAHVSTGPLNRFGVSLGSADGDVRARAEHMDGRRSGGCLCRLHAAPAFRTNLAPRLTANFIAAVRLRGSASAIQIVRPLEAIAETQPQLQPALVRAATPVFFGL